MAEASTEKPNGWEVRVRRRRESDAAILPRIRELWREGRTFPEIVAKINADIVEGGPLNSDGKPWTVQVVARVLKALTPPAEYAALAAAGMRRGTVAKSEAAKVVNKRAVARAVLLMQEGRSQDLAKDRLNAEGYRTSDGTFWTQGTLSDVLRRELSPDEHAALMPGGRMRGISAMQAEGKRRDNAELSLIMEIVEEGTTLNVVAPRLNAAGKVNGYGRAWNAKHVRDVLKRNLPPGEYEALAARNRKGPKPESPPILLYPGKPPRVLRPDGGRETIDIGDGAHGEAWWDILLAMKEAMPPGLSLRSLCRIRGGAKRILDDRLKIPCLAEIIRRPDKAKGTKWYMGPPLSTDG